jgi:uncharacterized protein
MPSEAVRQRLEALNRGPLPATMNAPTGPTALLKQAPTAKRAATGAPLRPGLVRSIPGLLRRGEVVSNELGTHLQVFLSMEELWPGGEALIQKRQERLRSLVPSGRKDFRAFVAAFPERAILLDLETCGLAGSALFLAGLLHRLDDGLAVELLLARDYSEEAAVLASLWQRIRAEGVVVTFNGKTFDWPMVIDRTRRHLLFRGTRPPTPQHVDLLHHARRRWRKQLPDCKLQTLERHICGRTRADDISGNQIPAAYQHFVRTGFDREINAILLHNAIDLVTMLDLAMRLAG